MKLLRAALAAAIPLALGDCGGAGGLGDGGGDTKADMPFKTENVCAGGAIPDGWIRTNDWRSNGCGIEKSGPALPKTKAEAKASAEVSPGVNTVADAGSNNWMTITEFDRVRVGRSLSACAGPVPAGWVEKSRYWDKGRCGNPAKSSEKNVMLIERVK